MESPIKPLLILGARNFAPEVADVASKMPGFKVVGFVENYEPERCQEKLEGLPVHWVEDIALFADSYWAICGLGSTLRSHFIEQVASYGFLFGKIIHPSAIISSKSSVGDGTFVSAGAIIASYTNIGCHVIINRGALIGHHIKIGDYVTIGPGVNIGSKCHIGKSTYIGIGAVVLDHISIGSHSVVGAGAVVTKDVPDHVQVVGIPAKIVKENITGK